MNWWPVSASWEVLARFHALRALLFPSRRRLQAVPLENVGHRLMADFVSQIAQRTNNPPVSPTAILPGKLQHERRLEKIPDKERALHSEHHGAKRIFSRAPGLYTFAA